MNFGKTEFFMLFLALVGLVLAWTAWHIDAQIKGCQSDRLHTANRMCLVLGVVLATSAIAFLWAQKVYATGAVQSRPNRSYMMAVMALGAVVMTLGLTIRTQASQENCDVSGSADFLLVLGGLGMAVPGYSIWSQRRLKSA